MFSMPTRRRARRFSLIPAFALVLVCPRASAQTFVQLSDMGENVGPRLTRVITQARVSRSLFGSIGTKVSFIDSGVVYQLVSDPTWARVTVGRWDQYIHEFLNAGGPGGVLGGVQGIDISARRTAFLADHTNGRIVAATLDINSKNLINAQSWGGVFPSPIDVAWDGGTSPLTLQYLFVLDDSIAQVSYWDASLGIPATHIWTYGTQGSGTGQFLRPTGVCAGKTAASNGGTQFTHDFYVVDRGNRRVVWLNKASGPVWEGTVSESGWDPTDCTVDNFGNLYVIDQSNHHLYKFTRSLTWLATYGSYGKGATNYNTFAYPHAVSVPCGVKAVNGQPVWYCEGRIVTAELWSDSSGATEHYLNLTASLTAGPDTSTYAATFSYFTTDHAYHVVRVFDLNNNTIRWLTSGGSAGQLIAPGTISWWWDGTKDDGTYASPGYYYFEAIATSAYGCGFQWCHPTIFTPQFWFKGKICGGGGGLNEMAARAEPMPPTGVAQLIGRPLEHVGCDPPAGAGVSTFLAQRVLTQPHPLAKVEGPATASTAAPAAQSGSLAPLIRQYGLMGLSFGISSSNTAPVTIRVYTLSGRLVRTLVNEALAPGAYEIGWDGTDDKGQRVGPGVYLARMTTGSFRSTEHLIVRQP